MKSIALAKIKNALERVFKFRVKNAMRLISESGHFNWLFFAEQVASEVTITSEAEAVKYFLNHSEFWHFKVSESFDGGWYLENYEDIKQSGINPLIHYLEHGAREGRIPVQNLALPYEKHLWAGLDDIMIPKLNKLLDLDDSSPLQKSYALWALARWFAWKNDQRNAVEYLEQFHKLKLVSPSHQGPTLLLISLLIELKRFADAIRWIELAKEKCSDTSDLSLLYSNLLFKQEPSSHAARLSIINRVYQKYNLPCITLKDKCSPLSLNNICSSAPIYKSEKVVSVVVPCFNAAKFITRALDSLLAQSWSKQEVIIVDDASRDSTVKVVKSWIVRNKKSFGEKTFFLVQMPENTGAYAARNIGMSKASGQYLTVHDADDFSHPSKIELQVKALESTESKASISYWVRCNDLLFFERWRMEDALIYRNVSSLMITRNVLGDLGYWDQVRFGADTEYYERIIAYYGDSAITEVLQNIPLSFGLSDDSSLTQAKSSHLVTQFAGVRKDYMSSARLWHKNANRELFLDKDEKVRKFPISASLLNSFQTNVAPSHPEDILRYSPYWSEEWYIRRYKPIQELNIDPVTHFIQTGSSMYFEIGPSLSLSFLKNFRKLSTKGALALEAIENEFTSMPFFVSGQATTKNTSVLLCGHAADKTLFGAELSFVDMVRAAFNNGYNVIAVLPSAENIAYIESLKPCCSRIYFVNDTWWQQGISYSSEVIVQYQKIFKAENIALVHINTMVQHNIYEAAHLANIPVITHVRELLSADSALRNSLCTSSKAGYMRIVEKSDVIIANSEKTKQEIVDSVSIDMNATPSVEVVPNVFDAPEAPSHSSTRKSGEVVRFGLVSSNIAKKGVADAVRLADTLESQGEVNAEIVLIGPKTDLISKLETEQLNGLHTLVKYIGYIERPQDIYDKLDVVLNLSHFAESFGRTVLEGMAFGKPTLCYDNGALSELVGHDETGFLVPFGDHASLVKFALKLIHDKALYKRLSEHSIRKANAHYSMSSYMSAQLTIYRNVLMRSNCRS